MHHALRPGFHHANAHIIAIKVFKAYFLLVDAYDSVSFLVWRENDKSLTLLSRDYSGRNTFAAGVISRARNLAFVVHDDRENIQVFQYAPNDDESEGGNKLVCRADMHIGTTAVDISSHYCTPVTICSSADAASSWALLKNHDKFGGGAGQVSE